MDVCHMSNVSALLLRTVLCCAMSLISIGGSASQSMDGNAASAGTKRVVHGVSKQASVDRRGTEDMPLVVRVLPSTEPTSEVASSQKQGVPETQRLWGFASEWWLVGFTGLLVLVTGALALYTARLWGATSRLVTGADATAERQLRAYVFVGEITATEVESPDPGLVNNWRIAVAWSNGGSTPTKNAICSINWQPMNQPMPADFDFPDRVGASRRLLMIGPRAEAHSAHVDIPIPLLDHVAAGNQFVYVWGWIDYNDILEGTPRHRTEFCYQLLKHGNLVSFQPHGRFNGADRECLRSPSMYET